MKLFKFFLLASLFCFFFLNESKPQCEPVPEAPVCSKVSDCDDGDVCTLDFCSSDGKCEHFFEENCCHDSNECIQKNECSNNETVLMWDGNCEDNQCVFSEHYCSGCQLSGENYLCSQVDPFTFSWKEKTYSSNKIISMVFATSYDDFTFNNLVVKLKLSVPNNSDKVIQVKQYNIENQDFTKEVLFKKGQTEVTVNVTYSDYEMSYPKGSVGGFTLYSLPYSWNENVVVQVCPESLTYKLLSYDGTYVMDLMSYGCETVFLN